MKITIRYNVEQGFEEAALRFARRLFAEVDEAIESLELIPVADEDLAVFLDGRLVHSQRRSGRAPRIADVIAAGGHLEDVPAPSDDSR